MMISARRQDHQVPRCGQHARPIAKGRLGKPIEFGHKAQLVDNDDGVVPDHTVEAGNPADAPQLAPR
jgi:transposase, IS5 family